MAARLQPIRRLLHQALGLGSRPAVFSPNHDSCLTCARHVTHKSATGFNDYDEAFKSFEMQIPPHFNFATDVIDVWAATPMTDSEKLALWWIDDHGNEIKWTFNDISVKSKIVANILTQQCGLGRGDRVKVVLPRLPEWWLLNIAAIRAGIVMSPGTTQLTSRDLRDRLGRLKAKCVITDSANAHKVDQMGEEAMQGLTRLLVGDENRTGWLSFPELFEKSSDDFQTVATRSDEPMTQFFTSGTTGPPKLTEHTHASYGLAHYITGKYWLDLIPSDVIWNMSDTGWAKAAWSSVFAPWTCGATVFAHHTTRRHDPLAVLEVLKRYPVTVFCGPPTLYRSLVLHPVPAISHLRHSVSAGEPLNPEVSGEWEKATGVAVREGYGQTETVLLCGSFRCLPNVPGSMGRPSPGHHLTILKANGTEAKENEEGEIALRINPSRPLGLFSRYVGEPLRTADRFMGDYFKTGDRAYRDKHGYFWFVGRSDDIITSAGYRIGPFEVESALVEHPAVAEAAAVASPDKDRFEVVKAFVVLAPGYEGRAELASELQDHVKAVTAPFKYPRKIEFVLDLPKTVSGKIRRIELRELEYSNI